MTIFNRLLKQTCTRFKIYDSFLGGDIWKFSMIERENLKNSTKNREIKPFLAK